MGVPVILNTSRFIPPAPQVSTAEVCPGAVRLTFFHGFLLYSTSVLLLLLPTSQTYHDFPGSGVVECVGAAVGEAWSVEKVRAGAELKRAVRAAGREARGITALLTPFLSSSVITKVSLDNKVIHTHTHLSLLITSSSLFSFPSRGHKYMQEYQDTWYDVHGV